MPAELDLSEVHRKLDLLLQRQTKQQELLVALAQKVEFYENKINKIPVPARRMLGL